MERSKQAPQKSNSDHASYEAKKIQPTHPSGQDNGIISTIANADTVSVCSLFLNQLDCEQLGCTRLGSKDSWSSSIRAVNGERNLRNARQVGRASIQEKLVKYHVFLPFLWNFVLPERTPINATIAIARHQSGFGWERSVYPSWPSPKRRHVVFN